MTKQQTIDQIKNSLPGFYSAEQIIEMLTKIEEPQPQSVSIDLPVLMEEIETAVSRRLDRFNNNDLVDFGSAEFSISNGNCIELEEVFVYRDGIVDICSEAVRQVLQKQLAPETDQDA